jgi:phosphohistidine swiveling domain-containing protein
MSPKLDKIDWALSYTRPNHPLFFMNSFMEIEGIWTQNVFGKGCMRQLCIYDKGNSYYIRSESETTGLTERISEIIIDGSFIPKFKEMSEKGKECLRIADELIAIFKTGVTDDYIRKEFKSIYAQYKEILFYTTSIPYFILSGTEAAIEKGHAKEKYAELFEQFEPLRAVSKYPEVNEFVLNRIYATAATLIGSDDPTTGGFLLPHEMELLMTEGRIDVSVSDLLLRKRWSASWTGPHDYKICLTTNPVDVLTVYNPNAHKGDNVKEVKGNIAYRGNIKGIVRIIHSSADIKLLKDGEILIAPSTNPELMSAMLRCGAIVTDEGGIACHAAIISRELKKPCVIGTKIATKVFKDGHMVEVDAEKGIVRLLNK